MVKKSLSEKVNDPTKKIKIVENMPDGIGWAPPGSSMLISTPRDVDALIRAIPKGKLASITIIRQHLAHLHGTDITCPISTGIFINMSAGAAAEQLDQGQAASGLAPYWRVLKADGLLNSKFPGGLEGHATKLEAEGFSIFRKTKAKWQVDNYEQALHAWTA